MFVGLARGINNLNFYNFNLNLTECKANPTHYFSRISEECALFYRIVLHNRFHMIQIDDSLLSQLAHRSHS